MRRRTVLLLLLTVIVSFAAAQQANRILETFQANFSSANLQTKLEILRSAETQDPVAFGPLYGQALSFVVSNAEKLYDEPLLREIGLISVNRINTAGYSNATDNLWRLFYLYDESTSRIQVLEVLGNVSTDSMEVLDLLTNWLIAQNNLFRSGGRTDFQVVATAVSIMGKFDSNAPFDAVLDIILFQYPDFVTAEAQKTLDGMPGEHLELALESVRRKDVLDKRSTFEYFVQATFLPEVELGPFAAGALADALRASPRSADERESLRQLRYDAANIIRANEYTEATSVMVRHFNQTVLEYDRGITAKNRVLEAIAGLGIMGTEEAAARLTDYLELLNTYTEVDRPYDTQIVLATIVNLQTLDSPESYNELFYTTLLENYPDRVKDAARQAMEAVSH